MTNMGPTKSCELLEPCKAGIGSHRTVTVTVSPAAWPGAAEGAAEAAVDGHHGKMRSGRD
jgi:hypothetical protein